MNNVLNTIKIPLFITSSACLKQATALLVVFVMPVLFIGCSEPKEAAVENESVTQSKLEPEAAELEGIVKLDVQGLTIEGGRNSMAVIGAIEVMGDYLYVADERNKSYKLHRFMIELEPVPTLRLDTSFGEGGSLPFERKITSLVSLSGELLVKTSRGEFVLKDNKLIESDWEFRLVASSSDGSKGLAFGKNGDLFIVEEASNDYELSSALTKDSWEKEDFRQIMRFHMTDNTILLGNNKDNPGAKGSMFELVGYSFDGNQIFSVGNSDSRAEDGFCYIHDIESIDDTILLLDSNCRDLLVVSSAGSLKNKIDLQRKLEVGYSWFPDSSSGPRGSLILAVINEDEQDDVAKAHFYLIAKSELLRKN